MSLNQNPSRKSATNRPLISASAPAFAAIISRLNAVRLGENLPRLGFLNPWLYSLNQTGFTDIVDAGSVGCASGPGPQVPYASWNATKGWDPVTGLGTPFYNTLAKVVKYSPASGE